MEIDQLELQNSQGKFKAYLLATINYKDSTYLYYVKELKDHYEIKDVYAGKLTDKETLEPVEEENLPYLESKLREMISIINKK